jgi:hypothetical protein
MVINKRISFFENKISQSIPATALYDKMYEHMTNENTKTPYLLFIGLDGFTAEGVTLFDNEEINAFTTLKNDGGAVYLAYQGGERAGDQRTISSCGWTTLLTGTWAKENSVFDNESVLNSSTPTIIKTLNDNGINSVFTYVFPPYGDVIYKDERAVYPNAFILNEDDESVENIMTANIQSGTRAIFGIVEYPDHAGHKNKFYLSNSEYVKSLHDAENSAMKLINTVKTREGYIDGTEDWLIIITSDHGGIYSWHGGKTFREREVFFATNKMVF